MPLPDSLDRSVRATATLTYSELHAEGKASAVDAVEWPLAQIVERLDDRLCPLCASVHGKVLAVDTPEYAEWRQPSHIGCRRVLAYLHRDEGAEATFERPAAELIQKHGHYHLRPRRYAELRMPAEPAGRHFIARRVRHVANGEVRTVLDWAPWWEQVSEAEKALVLRARLTESPEELRALLLALDIADPSDPEDFRRAVLLGLRDRLEGWVTDTDVARRVRETEDRIAGEPFEWLYAFAPSGEVRLEVRGEQYAVQISEADTDQLRGSIVTHNHPRGLAFAESDPRYRGNAFSPEDVRTAATYETVEMRAVSPAWRHSLRPGPEGWNAATWTDRIRPTAERHHHAVKAEFYARIDAGSLTQAEAEAEHWHEVWSRVARELGLRYARVPRRPPQS